MKRRDFLYKSTAAAGAITIPFLWACNKSDDDNNCSPCLPDNNLHFKYLEVSGTHYEIGKQIGQHFAKEIMAAKLGISEIVNDANNIVQAEPGLYYDPFLSAAQNHFPEYVEEIQGIADGSGFDFQDIWISNTFMEILYHYAENNPTLKFPGLTNLGCSTVLYSKNGKNIMAHNEDLFTCFLGNMYILKVKIPGKPEFMGLNYPGILPGMPPGMNEAGIFQTGNDICGLNIKPDVPMVFHFRSVMEASSLNDAVQRAEYPHRARTMTHSIGSTVENKIICVEAAPTKYHATEVDGFYVHTNHFISPDMLDIPIDPSGNESSESRFNELSSETQAYANLPDEVNGDLLTTFMTSHNGIVPPCVHDHGGASTLSHGLFDFQQKNLKIYFSNPCLGNSKIYSL